MNIRIARSFSLLALLTAPVQAQTLMVWGDDSQGQISDAPDGEFRAIAGGSVNGLALRRDRTPVLWGSGPIGPPPIPDSLAAERFHAVSIGRDDAALIRLDGTLAAFGQHEAIKNVPAGTYSDVAVAVVHAVAIADDGALVTWGSDAGLLHAPGGGPFKQVEATLLYSLALHEDGTLYGWGRAAQGTFVLAGWTPTPEDPQILYVPDKKFKAIAAGNVHALAIQVEEGTVEGWGNGTGGALQAPEGVKFKEVAAGWGFSVGLATDGTLWGWGTPHSITIPFATDVWTFASQGWTRHGDSDHYFIPNQRFRSIAAAAFHVMAITAGP
jgi:hypothetical protein